MAPAVSQVIPWERIQEHRLPGRTLRIPEHHRHTGTYTIRSFAFEEGDWAVFILVSDAPRLDSVNPFQVQAVITLRVRMSAVRVKANVRGEPVALVSGSICYPFGTQ